MILQVPIDALMLCAAAMTAYGLRFSDWALALKPVLFEITFVGFISLSLPVLLAWVVVFSLLGLYTPDPNRKFGTEVVRLFWGTLIGVGLVAMYIVFTQEPFDSRFLLVVSWFIGFFYLVIGRLLVRGIRLLLYRSGVGARQVILIGKGTIAETLLAAFREEKRLGYRVVTHIGELGSEEVTTLDRYTFEEIIYTDTEHTELAIALIEYANDRHVTFKYAADLLGTYFSKVSMYPIAGIPLAELKPTPLEGWGRVTKRVFDIMLSISILILTLPITLMSALIIVIETGRPVIYRNERVGVRGRTFFVYKFRSMYRQDSTGVQFGESGKQALEREEELIRKKNVRMGPIYKIADDPRVTPFGRVIRRWSIDELPQFLNVLMGSMSVVGPRPHQPREVSQYRQEDRKIFVVKPGITGLAQISGRSDLSYEEEMHLDALYVKNWNLITDIIIVFKTPLALFRRRNVV